MPNIRTPSFVRDPDQAAELAALLEDVAEELEHDIQGQTGEMTRRDRTRHDQTVARYRRWANELSPGSVAQPVPLQIRPADALTRERAERQGANQGGYGLMRYLVEFEDNKIGRGNRAESQTIEAEDRDDLGDKIRKYAGRFLASSGVDVLLNDEGRGYIAVGGFRTVARFTVKEATD